MLLDALMSSSGTVEQQRGNKILQGFARQLLQGRVEEEAKQKRQAASTRGGGGGGRAPGGKNGTGGGRR